MISCPYCQSDVPAKFNICPKCLRQIRCLSCKEVLAEDAPICLMCGEAVKYLERFARSNSINEYSYEEKRTQNSATRKIKWKGTDEAVKSIAGVLGINPNVSPLHLEPEDRFLDTSSNSLQHMIPENAGEAVHKEQKQITQGSGSYDYENVEQFFKPHGGESLRPNKVLNDYLASQITKKDRQQHFMLLYTSAYFEYFEKAVNKKQLTETIKQVKVDDPHNFTKHFNDAVENFFSEDSDGNLELDFHGQGEIEEIIKKVANPPGSNGTQAPRKAKQGSSSISNEKLQKVMPWVSKEVSAEYDTGSLSNSPSKWVLVVLYLLTQHLKIGEAVAISEAYPYATKQFPKIPIDSNSFSTAAKDLRKSGRVEQSHDKRAYLTPKGIEIAGKQLAQLKPST